MLKHQTFNSTMILQSAVASKVSSEFVLSYHRVSTEQTAKRYNYIKNVSTEC